MAVNKVVINDVNGENVLIDLTEDNIDAEALVVGFTAHDKSGEIIEGVNPYVKAETDATVSEQTGLISQLKDAIAENVNKTTAEVDTQTGLIAQIKDAISENVSKTSNEVSEQTGLIQQIKGAINENVGKTTAEVETQTDLIQQIKTALEGKAGGGGGTVLPTLTNPGTAEDLAEGKELIDAEGKVVTGVMPKALTIKSGTTTSRTINTGLSDVEQFFMYKENLTATGLIHLHYTKEATSRMYASAWSTNNYGTKTITNGTGGVTVSGGTVTISATQAAQGALSSGVTYKWIAVGTE